MKPPPSPAPPLTVHDHSRDLAGMTYVYPVISRRAGGVSVGINLNPNNACNWRCIYCQVPDLRRGSAPAIDLARLSAELRALLGQILHGDFMATRVPAGLRVLRDIALSGNGEPTSAAAFVQVIERLAQLRQEFGLADSGVKTVLITNGSLAHRPAVQAGIAALAGIEGEVWFKLDRATAAGMRQVNDTRTTPAQQLHRLRSVAARCPTWLQTCLFRLDGQPPAEAEVIAYLALLQHCQDSGIALRGVLLYGLARPSLQAEAARLSPVDAAWLDHFADRIRALGLDTRVTA